MSTPIHVPLATLCHSRLLSPSQGLRFWPPQRKSTYDRGKHISNSERRDRLKAERAGWCNPSPVFSGKCPDTFGIWLIQSTTRIFRTSRSGATKPGRTGDRTLGTCSLPPPLYCGLWSHSLPWLLAILWEADLPHQFFSSPLALTHTGPSQGQQGRQHVSTTPSSGQPPRSARPAAQTHITKTSWSSGLHTPCLFLNSGCDTRLVPVSIRHRSHFSLAEFDHPGTKKKSSGL
jgi:hypothetical protein